MYYLVQRKHYYDIVYHDGRNNKYLFLTPCSNTTIQEAFEDFNKNGLEYFSHLGNFEDFIRKNTILAKFKNEISFEEFQESHPEHLV